MYESRPTENEMMHRRRERKQAGPILSKFSNYVGVPPQEFNKV